MALSLTIGVVGELSRELFRNKFAEIFQERPRKPTVTYNYNGSEVQLTMKQIYLGRGFPSYRITKCDCIVFVVNPVDEKSVNEGLFWIDRTCISCSQFGKVDILKFIVMDLYGEKEFYSVGPFKRYGYPMFNVNLICDEVLPIFQDIISRTLDAKMNNRLVGDREIRRRIEQYHKPEFSSIVDYSRFFNKEEFSDLIFIFDERKLFLHRIILSSRASRLEQLIISSKNPNVIEISDCSFESFHFVMFYLYSFQFREEDIVDLDEIRSIAEKYQMELLSLECNRVMKGQEVLDSIFQFQNPLIKIKELDLEPFDVDIFCTSVLIILEELSLYIRDFVLSILDKLVYLTKYQISTLRRNVMLSIPEHVKTVNELMEKYYLLLTELLTEDELTTMFQNFRHTLLDASNLYIILAHKTHSNEELHDYDENNPYYLIKKFGTLAKRIVYLARKIADYPNELPPDVSSITTHYINFRLKENISMFFQRLLKVSEIVGDVSEDLLFRFFREQSILNIAKNAYSAFSEAIETTLVQHTFLKDNFFGLHVNIMNILSMTWEDEFFGECFPIQQNKFDVKFIFAEHNTVINGHKVVLSLHSNYFFQLFSNDQSSDIFTLSTNPKAFESIIHTIYSSKFEPKGKRSLPEIEEILDICVEYQFDYVYHLCKDWIYEKLPTHSLPQLPISIDMWKEILSHLSIFSILMMRRTCHTFLLIIESNKKQFSDTHYETEYSHHHVYLDKTVFSKIPKSERMAFFMRFSKCINSDYLFPSPKECLPSTLWIHKLTTKRKNKKRYHFCKILFVGNSFSGKETLIKQFLCGTDSDTHPNNMTRSILVNNRDVTIKCFQTSLTSQFDLNNCMKVFCFDLTRPMDEFLKYLGLYLNQARRPFIIVGTKMDGNRKMTYDEVVEMLEENITTLQFFYIETSAISNINVELLFMTISSLHVWSTALYVRLF